MELYVNAYCVPTICSPLSDQAVRVAVQNYPHLQGLELADVPNKPGEVEVDVVIGADYYWHLFTGVARKGERPGPVALQSRLSWVLSGPLNLNCENIQSSAVNIRATHVLKIESTPVEFNEDTGDINDHLHKLWDLETLGIHKNEISVYDGFTQEVRFNGERYEAKLPFKEDHPLLHDNYSTSVKRLESLIHRLRNKPEVLREYTRIMQEQLKEGIIDFVEQQSKNDRNLLGSEND